MTATVRALHASSDFVPAPPPVDPCTLLTLADAQMIVPDALPGELDPPPPDGDYFWSRDCAWSSASNGEGGEADRGYAGKRAAFASECATGS